MINLLSNAIKFSNHSDIIDVFVKTAEIKDENNKLEVLITVKDYGLGISKED